MRPAPVEDTDALALDRGHRGERPHLPQPLAGARRQFQPGRIGAVDDVHVVIAGQDEGPLGQRGMARQRVEELGPFGRPAGIGHVAGDQDEVERVLRMDLAEPIENLGEPLIAAWAGTAALDPEAVALADDMDVGEMGDAPSGGGRRHLVERREIARLVHARVGHAPGERGDCQIARHQHDGVGERGNDQPQGLGEVRELAGPARRWPGERGQAGGGGTGAKAGAERRRGPQVRAPVLAGLQREKALGQMAQALPAQGIARLDHERVQRPEAALGGAKQRADTIPAQCRDQREKQQ